MFEDISGHYKKVGIHNCYDFVFASILGRPINHDFQPTLLGMEEDFSVVSSKRKAEVVGVLIDERYASKYFSHLGLVTDGGNSITHKPGGGARCRNYFYGKFFVRV